MGHAGKEMVGARFSTERHVAALEEAYQAARTSWESDRAQSANRVRVRGT
jgi:hypothetical protein